MTRQSKSLIIIILIAVQLLSCQRNVTQQQNPQQKSTSRIKALIVDGQNNHGVWPKTTIMMKDYLEQTGLFSVDISRTAYTWQGPHNDNDDNFSKEERMQLLEKFPIPDGKNFTMVDKPVPDPAFEPDFSQYDVVISNFGWTAAPWPQQTQAAFETYVRNGGGLVVIHAADNSFPEWIAFNKMTGVGGWSNRSEKDGPYVYYNDSNELIRDTSPGGAGSHGKQSEFLITIREPSHPITQGMPRQWLHAKDELYDRLRGPAENMNVLATAYSDEKENATSYQKGTARHEPMLITVEYGKGRIFHTPLGHADYSLECVGLIVAFQRGTEWAATGKVTQPGIPDDFPTAEKTSTRKWDKQ